MEIKEKNYPGLPAARLPDGQGRQGFTFLEILVVMLITMIMVTVLSGMFFSILKGSAKSRIMADIKQNGSYALTVMERMARNAKSVLVNSSTKITIISQDNKPTIFECTADNISSNSGQLIDSTRVKVASCSFVVIEGELGRTPAAVTINFTLEQKVSPGRAEDKSMMEFNSQVVLRNY